jgi:hypothetical protein
LPELPSAPVATRALTYNLTYIYDGWGKPFL